MAYCANPPWTNQRRKTNKKREKKRASTAKWVVPSLLCNTVSSTVGQQRLCPQLEMLDLSRNRLSTTEIYLGVSHFHTLYCLSAAVGSLCLSMLGRSVLRIEACMCSGADTAFWKCPIMTHPMSCNSKLQHTKPTGEFSLILSFCCQHFFMEMTTVVCVDDRLNRWQAALSTIQL